METGKIITKVSIKDTLIAMKSGQRHDLEGIKIKSLRQAAYKLKSKGYRFKIIEVSKNEILLRCIKSPL